MLYVSFHPEEFNMSDTTNEQGSHGLRSFLLGVFAAFFVLTAFIVVDQCLLGGKYTTQNAEIQQLEETIETLQTSVQDGEAFALQLALELGFATLKEAQELMNEKALAKEKDAAEAKARGLGEEVQGLTQERAKSIEEMQAKLATIQTLEEKVTYLKSQFDGAFLEILKDYDDVSTSGGRFVFKDDVFFNNASVRISAAGKERLKRVAEQIKRIEEVAPKEMQWFIRIDGHANHLNIHTEKFPSNWHLSAGRAIAVVMYLLKEGINPHRVVAAGFGSQWPLVPETDKASLAKNRRIEVSFSHY